MTCFRHTSSGSTQMKIRRKCSTNSSDYARSSITEHERLEHYEKTGKGLMRTAALAGREGPNLSLQRHLARHIASRVSLKHENKFSCLG
ncbi:MAG: hypothetical protein ACP5NC_02015 [Nitrososphaeria archaeon]